LGLGGLTSSFSSQSAMGGPGGLTGRTPNLGLGSMDPTASSLSTLLNSSIGASSPGSVWAHPSNQVTGMGPRGSPAPPTSLETHDPFSSTLGSMLNFLRDDSSGVASSMGQLNQGLTKEYGLGPQSELLPTAQPFIPGTSNSSRRHIPDRDVARDRGGRREVIKHQNNSRNFEGWR
jgi:hypothetical protein